jgi:hypothetical protein
MPRDGAAARAASDSGKRAIIAGQYTGAQTTVKPAAVFPAERVAAIERIVNAADIAPKNSRQFS